MTLAYSRCLIVSDWPPFLVFVLYVCRPGEPFSGTYSRGLTPEFEFVPENRSPGFARGFGLVLATLIKLCPNALCTLTYCGTRLSLMGGGSLFDRIYSV